MAPSTPANVGETGDSFTPLSVEEAQALMTDALTGLDRNELLAERAEAEAQLRAAEATLGMTPTAPNGVGPAEQEQDGAVQNTQDVDSANGAVTLDVVELRRAANAARTADDALARAASEAPLGPAEPAFARALEIQEELPAAWRRLVGALISATGMAIVIGALGWNTYWLLVPIALIAILTIDLRLAGKAAREAPAGAPEGSGEFERIRRQRFELAEAEAEARLAAARADRDAAYARFEELAPGRLPSEVEEIVAEYEAEQMARAEAEAEARAAAQAEAEAAAQAEAEAAAQAEAQTAAEVETEALPATLTEAEATAGEPIEPAPEQVEPAPEQVEPAPEQVEPAVEVPASASEWWFGSKEVPAPPPAASAPVRALAERLSAEGREALARIEAQLAALDRMELARKSLEWHEGNGSGEPADASSEKN